MPSLIFGLGNPGHHYALTRHNLGFMVVDRLAGKLGVSLGRHEYGALVGEGWPAGKRLLLLKPQTYMNRSGLSVSHALADTGLAPSEILVIHDDLDLERGRIRIRPRGGSGGHRGVQSVIDALGTEAFPRLRVGIGRPPPGVDPVCYVLQPFEPEEREVMEEAVERAAAAVELMLAEGLEEAMNRFNG